MEVYNTSMLLFILKQNKMYIQETIIDCALGN